MFNDTLEPQLLIKKNFLGWWLFVGRGCVCVCVCVLVFLICCCFYWVFDVVAVSWLLFFSIIHWQENLRKYLFYFKNK